MSVLSQLSSLLMVRYCNFLLLANREDGARLDVVARDFWGRNRQRAFFDVRVFNPFARSYLRTPLSKCYHLHEQEKRWAYDERVRESTCADEMQYGPSPK